MQKRKNIRLAALLTALVIITIGTWYFLQQEEYVISDPALFAVKDVSQIDSVVLVKNEDTILLSYRNNEWRLNNEYAVDEQNLTVLFAILNQVRAKRPIAAAEAGKIDSLFTQQGVEVKFFEGNNQVSNFQVAGIEDRGLSYFKNGDQAFLVNIPGYRSYLAALFLMDPMEWRNRLIFDDVSWQNLEKVEVNFPNREDFTIRPEGNYFTIEGIAATDSLKLLDYLDKVSLLMAEQYVKSNELKTDSLLNMPSFLHLAVTDIRNKPYDLNIYRTVGEGYIAVKDSTDWMLINERDIQPLLKEKEYFKK